MMTDLPLSWRALLPSILLLGCGPRIDAGLSAAERWSQLAPIVQSEGPAGRVVLVAVQEGGFAFDPPGREGLAWTVAHGRWRGGAGTRSADEMGWATYTHDLQLDIDVGARFVRTTLDCPATQTDLCVSLWTAAFSAPVFDAAGMAATELRRRRHVALDHEDPTRAAKLLGRRAVQGVHPRGQAAAGRTQSTMGLPVALVEARRRAIDTRGNVAFSVLGGDAAVVTALDEVRAAMPIGPPLDDAAPPPRPIEADVVVGVVPGPHAGVALVARSTGTRADQLSAQDVLATLAGEVLGVPTETSGTGEGDVGVVVSVAAADAAAVAAVLWRLARSLEHRTLDDQAVDRVIAPLRASAEPPRSDGLPGSHRVDLDRDASLASLERLMDWKLVVAGPGPDTLRSAWIDHAGLEETIGSLVQAGELVDGFEHGGPPVGDADLLVAEEWTR